MKVTWEEEDVQGGRKVVKQGKDDIWIMGGNSYGITLTSLLDGLVFFIGKKLDDEGKDKSPGEAKIEAAEFLTKHEYLPLEAMRNDVARSQWPKAKAIANTHTGCRW